MTSSPSRSGSKSSRSKGKNNDSQSRERKGPRRSSKERKSRSNSSRNSKDKRSRSPQERRNFSSHYHERRDLDKIPKSTKLFITNIDSKYSQDEIKTDLQTSFSTFGKIKDIVVKTKHGSNNSYAFIDFQNIEGATKAQQQMMGKQFKGKELKVQFGRGERKQQDRRSDKCYICHREGHFAKECKYNRNEDRRDYDRHKRRHSRSRSRSSSGRSHRKRYDRDDYKRRDDYKHRDDYKRDDYKYRDSRRSPQSKSAYRSRRY